MAEEGKEVDIQSKSTEYLKHHLDLKTNYDFLEKSLPPRRGLYREIGGSQTYEEVRDYYLKNGQGKFIQGNIEISFSQKLAQPKPKQVPDTFKNSLFPIHVLHKLILEDTQSGYSINFLQLLPPKTLVFFIPKHLLWNNIPTQADFTDPKNKCVGICGLLNLPATIIKLLHEMGHLIEYQSSSEENIRLSRESRIKSRRSEDLTPQNAEAILRSERNAWAFCLRYLKPFINQANSLFPKDAVEDFIHNFALHSYGESIDKQTKELKIDDI